jgi:hypothetical protein
MQRQIDFDLVESGESAGSRVGAGTSQHPGGGRGSGPREERPRRGTSSRRSSRSGGRGRRG